VYTAPVEKWVDILTLAQRWEFKEVEQLCIREMQKLPILPVEKIHIYQKFRIDRSHLVESFAKLTVRQEPLKLEEALKVGLETMLQISQARELSRGSNSGTKPAPIRLNDSELRSVIQEAFGIVEDPFVDFQVGGFFSFTTILLMFFPLSLQRRALVNRSNRQKHILPPLTLVDAKIRSEQLRGKLVGRCAPNVSSSTTAPSFCVVAVLRCTRRCLALLFLYVFLLLSDFMFMA
jgi:hypothetical protein